MTVEELITCLRTMPPQADVFTSDSSYPPRQITTVMVTMRTADGKCLWPLGCESEHKTVVIIK